MAFSSRKIVILVLAGLASLASRQALAYDPYSQVPAGDPAHYFSAGCFYSFATSPQILALEGNEEKLKQMIAGYRSEFTAISAPPAVLQNFDEVAAGIEAARLFTPFDQWTAADNAAWAKVQVDYGPVKQWLGDDLHTAGHFYLDLGTDATNLGPVFGVMHASMGWKITDFQVLPGCLRHFVVYRDQFPKALVTLSPEGQSAIRELAALSEQVDGGQALSEDQFKRMAELGNQLFNANANHTLIVGSGPDTATSTPSTPSTPSGQGTSLYFAAGCFVSFSSDYQILSKEGSPEKLKELLDAYRSDFVKLSAPPEVMQNVDGVIRIVESVDVSKPYEQWTSAEQAAWDKNKFDVHTVTRWLGLGSNEQFYFTLGTCATNMGPLFASLHSRFGFSVKVLTPQVLENLNRFVAMRDNYPSALSTLSPSGQSGVREMAALYEQIAPSRSMTEDQFKRMNDVCTAIYQANANGTLVVGGAASAPPAQTQAEEAPIQTASNPPPATSGQAPVGQPVNLFNAGAMMEILLNPAYLAGMKANGQLDNQLSNGRNILRAAQAPDEVMTDYDRAGQVINALPFDQPLQDWSPAQHDQLRTARLGSAVLEAWLGRRTDRDFFYYLGSNCAYLGHIVPDDVNRLHMSEASLQPRIATALKDFIRMSQNSPDAVQMLGPAERRTFQNLVGEAKSCFQAHQAPPPQLLHEMEQQADSLFKAGDSYQLTQ